MPFQSFNKWTGRRLRAEIRLRGDRKKAGSSMAQPEQRAGPDGPVLSRPVRCSTGRAPILVPQVSATLGRTRTVVMSLEAENAIYSRDRSHRVFIFRRPDGTFGFEDQKYSSDSNEQCWLPVGRYSDSRTPSAEDALREAIGRVAW